ncbi:hypothetical protein KUU78_31185 (plasmid) [Pseudomonas aeruginosa]|jgi:hypothetical protein|uniref:Uncharacterized protein n=1 Tax=Burkholderia orbicola TaxID=2978683 RepID=A0ABT8P1H7_9BURK|nr:MULTISPECIES: DUF6750 family protein [Pseudomonadota]MBY9629176.1 hypothetical protein [Pseudomonas aeruginosa]MBY9844575.1 hypothetical protein [Pseudomonas aeruginosa]MCO8627565.1 hypothetical protein [Burkholderia multivorans]MDN7527698.1 hypothetical protein [Burkholderia orbicola]NYS16926.1 hypothetical protein [Achromobacter xylosoxidans]
MKKAMLKPVEWLGDLGRKAHIAAAAKCADYVESRTPRERRIMLASAAMTFTGLCVATAAHADGQGIAGMVDTAAQQGDSIKTNLGKLFAVVGFGGAGYGGYNWWRKGKEGEHSQIKGGQIFVPILAGAALGATGFVMIKAGETVGIQSSSQGQIPQ